MAEANSQFGRIKIAARGPQSEGIFKITAGGVVWRKAGGGRHIDIPVNDISSLRWTRVGKFCQLCVQRLREPSMTFVGFREQDYEGIAKMSQELLSKSVKQLQMTADGRNWGDARVNGSLLDFMATDSKLSFTVNLSDVVMAQLASNKNDVQLEFQTDDTSGKGIDSLCEMSVYVPPTHEEFATDEETPAPKNFLDTVLRKSNAGAVTSADAIITFHEIAVLAPRGRFDFEMHASFLKLLGQSQEFRVAYSSISRIFVLPKSAQHHVLVAISLDPPIRKGQTFYQHILCQFHSDEEETATLDISDELFQAKNERCGGKLQREFEGTKSDVFSRVLRGIAAAKITRTGNFRAVDGQSLALKCTYKAEQGHLYPLERAFFFVNKPPLLITHDEIESVEFQRQGRESMAAAKTFDLMMTLRNEQQYQFRNIEKNEWANLFEWAQAKNLRIENLAEAQQGPGGTANVALEIDDVSDEDEDFKMGSGDDDDGEPSEEDSDDAEDDVASADLSGDDGGDGDAPKSKAPEAKAKPKHSEEKPKPPPAQKKQKAEPKASRKAPEAADGKAPKKRQKKDKNAPKGPMSAFMHFSNEVRDSVKRENPEAAFGDIGKIIGAKWKEMNDPDKVPYIEMAAKDKQRYEQEMKEYKAKLAE